MSGIEAVNGTNFYYFNRFYLVSWAAQIRRGCELFTSVANAASRSKIISLYQRQNAWAIRNGILAMRVGDWFLYWFLTYRKSHHLNISTVHILEFTCHKTLFMLSCIRRRRESNQAVEENVRKKAIRNENQQ